MASQQPAEPERTAPPSPPAVDATSNSSPTPTPPLSLQLQSQPQFTSPAPPATASSPTQQQRATASHVEHLPRHIVLPPVTAFQTPDRQQRTRNVPPGISPAVQRIVLADRATEDAFPGALASASSSSPAPMFAEQLATPRRRQGAGLQAAFAAAATGWNADDATGVPSAAFIPGTGMAAVDDEEDVYRGPRPSRPLARPRMQRRVDTSGRELDEEAVSLRSFSSRGTGSSSSSNASVMSRVRDAFEAIGRGLGVLSSDSGGSSSSSSSSNSDDDTHSRARRPSSSAARPRRRKMSRRDGPPRRRGARSRAFSFGSWMGGSSSSDSGSSSDSDDEPLGRRKVHGRREFVLLLPNANSMASSSTGTPVPPPVIHGTAGPLPVPAEPRIITTVSLPQILQAIKDLRTPSTPPATPAASVGASIPLTHSPSGPTTRFAPLTALTPRQLLGLEPNTRTSTLVPPPPTVVLPPPPILLSQQPSTHTIPRRMPPPNQSLGKHLSKRFQPPSIPLPASVLHAPLPATPQPSPPASGTATPISSYFATEKVVPAVQVQAPTPGLEEPPGSSRASPPEEIFMGESNGWWLDVHCPGWEDMRALGELLNLHPLTLEDILQQDPREKLEVFDRLGYYLICLRAIDESYFRWTDADSAPPAIMSITPPFDPTLGPTNPSLPGNPSSEPVLVGMTGQAAAPTETLNVGGGYRSRRSGRRRGKVEIVEDRPGKEGLEGVGVGAANVYLIVFKDGIISFHFDDMTKHTQMVRNRVLTLEQGSTLSADWIAHGLMDSIVDSFFPLIDFIEEEADDIESQIVQHDALVESSADDVLGGSSSAESATPPVYSPTPSDDAKLARQKLGLDSDSDVQILEMQTFEREPKTGAILPVGGGGVASPATSSSEFPLPSITKLVLRRVQIFGRACAIRILLILSLHPSQRRARRQRRGELDPHLRYKRQHAFNRVEMLKRMTATRRLVTGLSRLLIPKSEVVGRLKRRAEEVSGGNWGVVGGEMVTYIGDVQDHILSMQGALAHYDRLLSQAQPAYIAQLQVSLAAAKNGTDRQILLLSYITIGVLPCVLLTSIFSVNVNTPRNGDREHKYNAPKNVFGIIIAGVLIIVTSFYYLVEHWKAQARVKSGKRSNNIF